jgi:hypothetical protein
MRYVLLIYTNPTVWPSLPKADTDQMMNEYWVFTKEITESGEMVAGDALTGVETASTVRVRDGKASTTDGPFAETKEHLAGYYVVDVKDLDRALELAGRIPDVRFGSVEVRPIMDMGDAPDVSL